MILVEPYTSEPLSGSLLSYSVMFDARCSRTTVGIPIDHSVLSVISQIIDESDAAVLSLIMENVNDYY
jgi:hypothetical protein